MGVMQFLSLEDLRDNLLQPYVFSCGNDAPMNEELWARVGCKDQDLGLPTSSSTTHTPPFPFGTVHIRAQALSGFLHSPVQTCQCYLDSPGFGSHCLHQVSS